jgi:hypothetical protein
MPLRFTRSGEAEAPCTAGAVRCVAAHGVLHRPREAGNVRELVPAHVELV